MRNLIQLLIILTQYLFVLRFQYVSRDFLSATLPCSNAPLLRSQLRAQNSTHSNPSWIPTCPHSAPITRLEFLGLVSVEFWAMGTARTMRESPPMILFTIFDQVPFFVTCKIKRCVNYLHDYIFMTLAYFYDKLNESRRERLHKSMEVLPSWFNAAKLLSWSHNSSRGLQACSEKKQ